MEKDAKKLKLSLQREAQALIELYPIVGGYYTDKTMISLSLLEVVKFGKYCPILEMEILCQNSYGPKHFPLDFKSLKVLL